MDIFWAVRLNDLDRVKVFVEQDPSIVNERYFDANPLYYAAHCGHYDLCEYLLQQGSSCAEDTFDGDRCLYGAHTDCIRALLKRYSQRKTFVLPKYIKSINSLLVHGTDSDFEFRVNGSSFKCHRVVIASRIPSLKSRFETRWLRRSGVSIRDAKISENAFSSLLKYCYSDTLECGLGDVESLEYICCRFSLWRLGKAIALGKKMTSSSLIKLHPLGRQNMPADFKNTRKNMASIADCELKCENSTLRIHKAIIHCRSQYFQTRLASGFSDSNEMNIPANVVEACIQFLYTDGLGCEEILFGDTDDPEILTAELIALLDMGTQFLIPDLCDFVCKCLLERGLVSRRNSTEWLTLSLVYPVLLSAIVQVIGEDMARSIVEDEPLLKTKDLQNFLEKREKSQRDLIIAEILEKREKSQRDLIIAEIREALVESLPVNIEMSKLNKITDNFETELNYQL